MSDQRQAYAERLEAQLGEWNAQLELLKAKALVAKADLKLEYAKTIDALQQKQQEGQTRLQELKASGEEAWEDLGKGAERMLAEGKAAFHDAVSRFK